MDQAKPKNKTVCRSLRKCGEDSDFGSDDWLFTAATGSNWKYEQEVLTRDCQAYQFEPDQSAMLDRFDHEAAGNRTSAASLTTA